MDKKIIGLLIVIIIGVVAISGCTSDENKNTNSKDDKNLTKEQQKETLDHVKSQSAIAKAGVKHSEENPNEGYSYNTAKSSANLTTYNGKEMYKVSLCVVDKNKKESYVTYYVDLEDDTVISG